MWDLINHGLLCIFKIINALLISQNGLSDSCNVIGSVLVSESVTNVVSKEFLSNFKYLRFLSLERSCSELPDTTCTLKHLGSLNLSRCYYSKRLSDSICKLYNLQTLNLSDCMSFRELPKNIDLMNLRYLWITTHQMYLPHNNRIECLPSLQFLGFVRCYHLLTLFENAGNLTPTLRTLIVEYCDNLVSLFSLSGSTTRKYSLTALEVLRIDHCPSLDLNYKIRKDREGDDHDKNSQYLHLPRLRSLELSTLPRLKHFPEWVHGCAATLQFLKIYWCRNLITLPEWLPNLTSHRTLEIDYCTELLSLLQGMERLASFHTLKIQHCPKLLCLPRGMERLAALKQLRIVNCGELGRRCRKETGEDWPKIAHVPNISLSVCD